MITIERPDIADGQQFIQWTQSHQLIAIGLPPAASNLWKDLLRSSTCEALIEIDLKEELEAISLGRDKLYSIRTLKDALKRLANNPDPLVVIVHDYGRGIFKILVCHPHKSIQKEGGVS